MAFLLSYRRVGQRASTDPGFLQKIREKTFDMNCVVFTKIFAEM